MSCLAEKLPREGDSEAARNEPPRDSTPFFSHHFKQKHRNYQWNGILTRDKFLPLHSWLTVSNPKIARGSYFLRVNKITHDGGIYKTTLLSLTIITTPEL